jgi:hypothetical protein
MTDGFDNLANDPIERELAELRRRIAFPPTPDLVPAVRTRIAARAARRAPVRLPGWRPVLVAAAVVVLLALGLSLLSSTVRDTVADAFGVSGIRIEFREETPTAIATTPSTPTTPQLDLGRQVSLRDAAARSNLFLAMPDSAVLGQPDQVYLREQPDGGYLVTLVYLPTETLPPAAETGVGLLLMEFQSTNRVEFMVKGVMGTGQISEVFVNGSRGYWIEGTSTLMLINDASAPCCNGPERPSANVLLWQRGDVTFRMETALTLSEAMAIAESVAPVPPSLLTPTAEP